MNLIKIKIFKNVFLGDRFHSFLFIRFPKPIDTLILGNVFRANLLKFAVCEVYIFYFYLSFVDIIL